MEDKSKDTVIHSSAAASDDTSDAVAEFFYKNSSKLQNSALDSNKEKQLQLNDIIERLTKESLDINHSEEKYVQELKAVYTENFRHSYSELTRIILSHSTNPDDIFTLTGNFECLQEHINQLENKDFVKSFNKLNDHFLLESARLKYIENIRLVYSDNQRQSDEKIEQYKKEIKEIKADSKAKAGEYENTLKQYDQKITDKFNSATSQSMTILGIFSAVVFTFTGGFSVLGGAFSEGINTPFKWRFIFTVLLLCFTLFNILIGLISTLFRLSDGKTLAWPCKHSKSTVNQDICKGCSERCCLLSRLFRRYPAIAIADAVFIGSMAIIFILWLCSKYH